MDFLFLNQQHLFLSNYYIIGIHVYTLALHSQDLGPDIWCMLGKITTVYSLPAPVFVEILPLMDSFEECLYESVIQHFQNQTVNTLV